MNRIGLVALASFVLLSSAGNVSAQVAGSSSLGTTAEELRLVANGWSAKKQVLGKTVYNENNEKVGVIDDLIIAPDRAVSFAIIGAGGFVGVGKHDVLIPITQLKQAEGGKVVLPGATKQAIKALPKFEYARAK
jgi:sporulation protein YlmC with PRC-barrel domain